MTAVCFGSFALPLAAAGAAAAAAALPVLIHLLSRQRVQVVEWAAVRFLLAAQKRRRKRVDRWLLLAARVLALLVPLVALCAATPWAEAVWQAVSPGAQEAVSTAPRTHRVFLLDASLSMTTRAGDRTRFEAAVGLIEQAVLAANPGDGFTLITVGGTAQAVVPGPAADPDKLLAELRAVKPTHAAGDLAGGLALAADVLARSPRAFPRRQVVIATDLQRGAWAGLLPKPDGTVPDLWRRITPRADVAVVDAAGADVDNVAITDLTLDDPLALVDGPAAVTVAVHNFGQVDLKGVRVELALGRPAAAGPDAALVPLEQRTIDAIPAGQRVSVTFSLEGPTRFREPGMHLVQAKLAAGDDLVADDVRTLAVDVRAGLAVVLVDGKPAADPLRRGSEYLDRALAPGGRPRPGNPVRPRTLTPAEFADPVLGDLTQVDVVFLCDVPTLGPAQVARLDAHLRRGGGVVVGLGPQAAANVEFYNRALFAEGDGLLPGKLSAVRESPPAGFRLFGDDAAFRRPPLSAFRDDNVRAGLAGVPFAKYLRLDAPADGRARRVLSFAAPPPADPKAGPKPEAKEVDKPDPAVVEFPRHRGRVVVYTSTFNADWTDWPVLPTYLPFAHELVRSAAGTADRRTVRVGEPLEEFLPVNQVGQTAAVTGPDGLDAKVPVVAGDEAGLVRFADTHLSGVYRVSVGGRRDRVFAVNVPESTPGGGAESDLRRVAPADLKPLTGVSIVADPTDVGTAAGDPTIVTLGPRPHGPTLARWVLALALALIAVELLLAWRFGPARGRGLVPAGGPAPRGRSLGVVLALVPLVLAVSVLAVRLHDDLTGDFLGFLPEAARGQLERYAGVPTAAAGEGTRARLESAPAFLKSARADQRLAWAVFAVGTAGVVLLYRLERRAAGRTSRVVLPALLRIAALALVCFVMLPQLRLAFDREGWPDVAVLLDTSASMATVDDLQDPAVRARADELGRLDGVSQVDRLRLAKLLVTRGTPDLLARLLSERQVKVHVYSVADQAKLVAEVTEAADLDAGRAAIDKLAPDGEASRLGDAVQGVLKAFRGGSLTAVIAYTDGVITVGDDWQTAGREAARAGVPLYLVGLGDARDPPDLALADLKADDAVLKGDTLVFEARLTARGVGGPNVRVPVILSERQGDKLVERGRDTVAVDPTGKPTPVRLTTTPSEVGEKTYVIDVAPLPGEAEAGNNRLERVVLVTESKKLRVLYLDGYPRYEFRFLKSLLERESAAAGAKAVELNTVLADASPGYAEQDKSALRTLPTRAELDAYDVVILGDLDPERLPRAAQLFQDLADFVKVRGGGLLVIAGTQATPRRLFATPLADLLPVTASDATPAAEVLLVDGYRLKPTAYGQTHPLFRLAADEAENTRVWAGLKPLFWSATGYKRKLSAEVLATHPTRAGEGAAGELHPLVLQQFVGAGRVMFFGFDESWRWRFRAGEERYNQFWHQTVRVLARSRVTRAELRTDKQTAYRRDEPIRLTVRFPDDAPVPAADVPIKVRVDRRPLASGAGPSESQTVRLAKVDGSRATYQTLLTRTPDGDYRFELTDPPPVVAPGSPPGTPPPARPRAEARVLPPPGERDRLDMNRAELQRAAAESRGQFYTLADAAKLIDDLPDGTRVPLNQPVPPIPVWNHALVFGLFASLLGAEWLLRRRERLL